jgi:hypothetical protein
MPKAKEIIDAINAKTREADSLCQRLDAQAKGKYPNIKKLGNVLNKSRHAILHKGPFDALRQIEALVAAHSDMNEDIENIKNTVKAFKSKMDVMPDSKFPATRLAKAIRSKELDEVTNYGALEQQAADWLKKLEALGIVGEK